MRTRKFAYEIYWPLAMELHLLNLCFALHFAHQRKDVKGLANFYSYFLFVCDQKKYVWKDWRFVEVEKKLSGLNLGLGNLKHDIGILNEWNSYASMILVEVFQSFNLWLIKSWRIVYVDLKLRKLPVSVTL